MSFRYTVDVLCDRCDAWTNGVTGRQVERRAATRNAEAHGWRRARDNGYLIDICPDCVKKYLPERPMDGLVTKFKPLHYTGAYLNVLEAYHDQRRG
jgi:hypothetical protein